VCAAVLSVAFFARPGGTEVAVWAGALSIVSAHRWYIATEMSKRLADRHGLRRWALWTSIELFLLGCTWGALPWLPFDHADLGAWICVLMVPPAATWLAISSLSAVPMAIISMGVPLVCSLAALCMFGVGGVLGIVLGVAIPIYMCLNVMGFLAINGILVRERRLIHQLKLAAKQSGNQASALSAAFARLADAQSQLRIVNHQLETLATIDSLTGIANRRSFMEKLDAEYGLRSRYGAHFSLILMDLDHFKLVNDRFGHLVGDLVLKAATERVCGALRSTDILGRYGGEEFVALLPQTRLAEAKIVAERIRADLSAGAITAPACEVMVTASLGVAEWRGPGEDADAVLGRADRMLYVAKNGGRDRVVAEDPVIDGVSHG